MIYRRRFDASGEDSLAKLARWIPPGATVLELGAAAGYFTAHLASTGCAVDVVELDAEAAAEAAPHARRTIVADLEGDAWQHDLAGERYDVVVCADVLEHLRDGPRLLRRLLPLLHDDGALLMSVPNVAHSAIVAELLDERFDYGAEGLLDATHVHLYTWRTLLDALEGAGYRAAEWDATSLAPFDTEFRTRVEGLSPAVREVLEHRPHAFVYQWLVRALPGRGPHAVPPALHGTAMVPVRLLAAEDEASLALDRALRGAMPVGGTPAGLVWRLPPGTRTLRLLPADRSGVVDLLSLVLQRGDTPVWSFAAPGDVRTGNGAVRVSERRYALASGEAWLALAAPPEVVAEADRVEATLAWASGVAHQGLQQGFDAMAEALAGERETASVRIAALDAQVASLGARIATLEHERARSAEAAARAEALLDAERARLGQEIATRDRIIAYRQSARWWVRLPFVRMRMVLQRIGR